MRCSSCAESFSACARIAAICSSSLLSRSSTLLNRALASSVAVRASTRCFLNRRVAIAERLRQRLCQKPTDKSGQDEKVDNGKRCRRLFRHSSPTSRRVPSPQAEWRYASFSSASCLLASGDCASGELACAPRAAGCEDSCALEALEPAASPRIKNPGKQSCLHAGSLHCVTSGSKHRPAVPPSESASSTPRSSLQSAAVLPERSARSPAALPRTRSCVCCRTCANAASRSAFHCFNF